MKQLLLIFLIFSFSLVSAQNKVYSVRIALLKYSGGGDWYANPTSLPNLAIFCNQTINTNIDPNIPEVEPGSQDIFNYPFIHMTGHGNVIFSDFEAANIRKYLESGGFLHIDDNYGMDPFIRPQIKKIFPDIELIELPPSHPIFSQYFNFPNGLPKIHEHDGKPPQAFGIILNGRLVLLYTYECDLGDGWESEEVHNDPPEVRLKALQMGANIIHYAFNL
ncbi:MAG TPA: DUF4159 domain-containing protein [Bacteroidales bacterium]|jgi:hypothetical protein|nr:DUF4159 domain-containing protein [Bacteroidales bacterium]HNW21373.1 DUF4159 domain-containing protein [Bacteroidales bacterium]HOC40807.1 DUF4159 domain-containing protein [Bacteroidales bacterium]HPB20044.1 DUF4159 domain-containing protein [Bacteroidales bacterium]HPM40189.1 DUF4159 domain-containing protein [Bacteroidales bacterium]